MPLTTPWGNFHLHPGDVFFAVIGGLVCMISSSNGEGWTAPINPPMAVRPLLLGTSLYSQGVVVDPTKPNALRITNWTLTTF